MKAKTQAVLLEKMMKNKKVQPAYELTLPLFMLKQSILKELIKGDILLVGLKNLELILIQNNNTYANVSLLKAKKRQELECISIDKILSWSTIDPTYEVVKCLFSTLYIDALEVGKKQNISNVTFESITLLSENNVKKLEGKLVEVEDEIAIEVTKVYNEQR